HCTTKTSLYMLLATPNLALLDPNAYDREPPLIMPLNTILIKNSPQMTAIDSFHTIHKDLLVENLQTAQEFIKKSPEMVFKDRLRAIWTPVPGGRVFGRGEGHSSRNLPARLKSLKYDQLMVFSHGPCCGEPPARQQVIGMRGTRFLVCTIGWTILTLIGPDFQRQSSTMTLSSN
ncbi:hypothetical protein BS47DRAFT_1356158, partial [Hydnum rufescens UP504]